MRYFCGLLLNFHPRVIRTYAHARCVRVDMAVLSRLWQSIFPYRRGSLSHKTRQRNSDVHAYTVRVHIIVIACGYIQKLPRNLEPRKIILTAISRIRRKFVPTKITRYTIWGFRTLANFEGSLFVWSANDDVYRYSEHRD